MCVEQTDMCNIIVMKGSDAPRLQFNAVVLAPRSTDSFALLKALPLFLGSSEEHCIDKTDYRERESESRMI